MSREFLALETFQTTWTKAYCLKYYIGNSIKEKSQHFRICDCRLYFENLLWRTAGYQKHFNSNLITDCQDCFHTSSCRDQPSSSSSKTTQYQQIFGPIHNILVTVLDIFSGHPLGDTGNEQWIEMHLATWILLWMNRGLINSYLPQHTSGFRIDFGGFITA